MKKWSTKVLTRADEILLLAVFCLKDKTYGLQAAVSK